MKNKWELTEHLTDEQLDEQAEKLAAQLVDKNYRHNNGETYTVTGIVTININDTTYWGASYTKSTLKRTIHTRPLYEFLDGRFTLVK